MSVIKLAMRVMAQYCFITGCSCPMPWHLQSTKEDSSLMNLVLSDVLYACKMALHLLAYDQAKHCPSIVTGKVCNTLIRWAMSGALNNDEHAVALHDTVSNVMLYNDSSILTWL